MIKHASKYERANGSALILVVVVTVLLAAIGVMFLMVSRLSEMETMAVGDERDLNAAVQTVVTRIDETLVDDLFGNNGVMIDGDGSDEAYDAAAADDPWLASLEPDAASSFTWPRITDLYSAGWPDDNLQSTVVLAGDPAAANDMADADGDGVADSRWVRIPDLSSSRGRDVYAAVRIIDNCAMLNLNTAYCFYQEPEEEKNLRYVDPFGDPVSFFEKPWFENRADYLNDNLFHDDQSGRFLSEINYLPFLRGSDLFTPWPKQGKNWHNIMKTKGVFDFINNVPESPSICNGIYFNIENPGPNYHFFDIGDELEIRNRFLVTSLVESRFEQISVANYTLDAGGGTYGTLETPVDDVTFESWKVKLDPFYFDKWDATGNLLPTETRYRYDRRHVCTFYSFDRPLRSGDYPLLTANWAMQGWTQQQIASFEAVFRPQGAVTTNIETVGEAQPFNNLETRRKILHLLFAFREYEYRNNGGDLTAAAISAAQFVANLIDYSDDDAMNTQTTGESEGPFYNTLYGEQANVDCTFITEAIIQSMLQEVSGGNLPSGIPFGLGATDVVFGYERQPFISEVYAYRNPGNGGALEGFSIELLNPYPDNLPLYRNSLTGGTAENAWRIRVADGNPIDEPIWSLGKTVPAYDQTTNSPGRYIIHMATNAGVGSGPQVPGTFKLTELSHMDTLADKEIQLMRPAPKWVRDNLGINFIVVDRVANDQVQQLWSEEGYNAIKRQDTDWKFIYPQYAFQTSQYSTYTNTLGQANQVVLSPVDSYARYQIQVADNSYPVGRLQDLETMSLFGSGPNGTDPNEAVTNRLYTAAGNGDVMHLNLTGPTSVGSSADVRDYLCTFNRPEEGSLPGRININTAPAHVIAAAIPPTLADPNAIDPAKAVTYSALDMAQDIVNNRPYQTLSDLLKISRFYQYSTGGEWGDVNVGNPTIENDIEEDHWILSQLANKFTVRSDVFTAYFLVRLGQDGPQRRMIAIFDRTNVWTPNDRPTLVALHPVPDPR